VSWTSFGLLRHPEVMDVERKLLTVEELRRVVGKDRLGRDAAYALARRYGVKLGKRLLVPSRVVEAILEGRLEELAAKTPEVGPRGR
jgi:hypothetical protein